MARFVRISLLTLSAALLLATLVHSQDAPRRVRAYQDRQNELKAQGEATEQQSLGAIWAGGLELEAGRDGGLSRIAGLTGDEVDEDGEKHRQSADPTGMRVERIKRATTTRVTTITKKVTTTAVKATTTTKRTTAAPRTTTKKTTTTSPKTTTTTKKVTTTTKAASTLKTTTKPTTTSVKTTVTTKAATASAERIATPRTTPATSKSSTTSSSTSTTTTSSLVPTTTQASTTVAATTSSSTTSSPSTSTTSSSATTTSSSTTTTTSRSSTTTTGSSTCAPKYSAARMISGTGTLPKPTTFVKRASAGQGLTLDGTAFRVAGANIYWLCNDENVGLPKGQYTDKGRIREALAIAVAMGGNTIRVISCGVSLGSVYSTETSLGVFQSGAHWDVYDYVIYAAGQYGLRVILPLTDDYDYYHGGKYTFLRWLGLNTGNWGTLFYSNAQAIAAYKQYIYVYLTHQNTYNGLTYAQDPTIMMWETGNELGAYIGREGYPPATWTSSIASYIRGLAPNQLIMDGSDGFYNYSTKATAPGLNVATIDAMTDHGYPRNVALLNSQIPIATTAKKAFIIGEYDWTAAGGGDTLAAYHAAIESTSYLGSLFWSIMGHDAQCCAFVPHNDGYSMYYPNGNSAADQKNILAVVQHNYRLTGKTNVPTVLPGVACPQPVF